MAHVVLFVHGMGPHEEGWLDEKIELLRNHLTAQFIPISYSGVINEASLFEFGETSGRAAEDSGQQREEIIELAFVEGYLAGAAGDPPVVELEEAGVLRDRVSTGANLYKYAARYLWGKKIRDKIFNSVQQQIRLQLTKIPHGDKVSLMAHSLGTVVALDALGSSELRGREGARFTQFVTLGSPLGMINKLGSRLGERGLPRAKRKISIPWLDVVAENDPVIRLGRVSKALGFDGNPLDCQSIGQRKVNPHNSYFREDNAVLTWVPFVIV